MGSNGGGQAMEEMRTGLIAITLYTCVWKSEQKPTGHRNCQLSTQKPFNSWFIQYAGGGGDRLNNTTIMPEDFSAQMGTSI